MPDIFGNFGLGAFALVTGAGGTGRLSNIIVPELAGPSEVNILITSLGLSQSVKMLYFNTLGDNIYIYPLGNDVSKCIISGMAVPSSNCASGNTYDGAQKLITYYEKHRASNFKNVQAPITITFDPVSLTGFIDGMSMEISSDISSFGFVKFSITLAIIPERSK